jgi:hypothetical protein
VPVVAIAQQAEHQIVDLGVAGSNPASHPFKFAETHETAAAAAGDYALPRHASISLTLEPTRSTEFE